MILFEILDQITQFIISTISNSGYFGIFLLMVAESALIPIPSEIIMPFSGYLVSTGKFDLGLVIFAGSFGNLVGSLVAYYLGIKLGREIILRYGKYIFLKKNHLDFTEFYFSKYGDKSTFVGRLLPAVRTYISLPAGLAKMSVRKFIFYTFIGSVVWNTVLTFVGINLGENWGSIQKYSHYFDAIVIIGVIIGIIFFLKIKLKKSNAHS